MTKGSHLKEALFADHEAEMIRQAETIRDWPVGSERDEQAIIHVRQALYETPTRISEGTRYRIYSILHFVMPGDAWSVEEETPEEVLEQQAAWEIAHQKQLDQRSCPECGDGVCPAD